MSMSVNSSKRITLSQLRARLSSLDVFNSRILESRGLESKILESRIFEELSTDPRIGARRIVDRFKKRVERERQKRERLLHFERELWNMDYTYVAGIDEAGRGPLAGPVVAAAVIFPKGTYISGVDDSKKVSANKRELLYTEIMNTSYSVGVGVVSEKEIDRTNILQATFQAMHKALEVLTVHPQFILVDGRELPGSPCSQNAIVGGDSRSFSIAAASIVAKVTRDRIMSDYDQQFPEYGFARHKGYATSEHRAALAKYGPCDIHRRSFAWKRNV